jgi:maltose-binding protein MalE
MRRSKGLGWVLSVLMVLTVACATTPTQPAPAKPAESKPAEAAKPAEQKPAEQKPAEAAKPAEAKPTAVVEAKASGAVTGGEVVKITAWTIGPDAPSFYRRDNLVAAADSLNKELESEGSNQRVQVEATFESSTSGTAWNDFKQKFTLAAEAKQAPDIMLGGHEDLAPWSAAGYVIQLDSLLQKYPKNFEEIFPTIWPSMKLQGKTYQIPQDMEARPMYYRKDLLVKLGWPKERIDGLPGGQEGRVQHAGPGRDR